MLAAMRPGAKVVALDAGGSIWSTTELAERLDKWRVEAGELQLLVGGPDGLDERCVAAASEVWSLSRLTFPHFLVRVLLAEQLYRAWTVITNHPYHK